MMLSAVLGANSTHGKVFIYVGYPGCFGFVRIRIWVKISFDWGGDRLWFLQATKPRLTAVNETHTTLKQTVQTESSSVSY